MGFAVEPGGGGFGQRRRRLEIGGQRAGVEPLAEHGGQCALPFFGHADVLPQGGRIGLFAALPEVVAGGVGQQGGEGFLLGFGGEDAAFVFLFAFAGGGEGGFQVACLLFEPLQLLLALLVLGGEGVGPGLDGGSILPGIALQGGGFLLQAGLALLQSAHALAAVLQLLLLQGELAAEAGGFIVPALLLFGGLLLGGFELGQLLFEGAGFGGEQFELHLLLFDSLPGLGVLLLQLGMFAVDFPNGGLGGGLFAFEALALALPRADLLFEAGGLLAQQGVLLVEPVLLGLLLLLGLAQHLHGIVHGLVLPDDLVLPLAGAFVFGGGAVGGGKRVPPLGEVVMILRLVELGGEAAVAFGGGGLALEFFHLAAEFGLQIAEALEVFAGVAQAVFGFAAAFFVFGYAGGFFDVGA